MAVIDAPEGPTQFIVTVSLLSTPKGVCGKSVAAVISLMGIISAGALPRVTVTVAFCSPCSTV
ncbi:MAG: hypothetical protein RRY54_07445, partial [Angelakisella sp.]